jgi:uncharacterized iron-regulated membrane protein
MSVLSRLRRFWLDVHLWLGVGLLIPFVILGVTGSVLVWHDDFERALEPQRYAVSDGPSLPLEAHLASARTAFGPDFVVTQVRPPEHAGEPLVVQARAKARPPEGQRPATRSAWLDPATARVLDVANPRESVFGVMHTLHGSLMIPDNGRKIVGWMGWGMLASSLTGIWLWWPRNSNLLAGLRWRRSPHTTFNLHNFMGFWVSIPLAILALTGVYISFPQMSQTLVAPLVGEQPAEARPRPLGGGPPPLERTHTSIDAVLASAQAAMPGAEIVSIVLPTRAREGSPSWRIQAQEADASAFALPASIQIDDETGEARVGKAPSDTDIAARVMRRVHDGVGLGPVWQTIIFIGGWAPAVFGFTGVIMWLRRRKARRLNPA